MVALVAVVLAHTALTSMPDPGAARPIEVAYTSSAIGCVIQPQGEMDNHFVVYRCPGVPGYPVWVAYAEGVRMSLAIGDNPTYEGIFSTRRDSNWPVEWRGYRASRFQPYAAIIRVEGIEGGQMLAVYGVLRDGRSCLRGTETTNEAARALADATAGHHC